MKALSRIQPPPKSTRGRREVFRRFPPRVVTSDARHLSWIPTLQRSPACACGGGCPRCQQAQLPIQPKLKIDAPNDQYEREADLVADQIMRMPEPVIRAGRTERQSLSLPNESSSQIGALHSGGHPLPESVRGYFEPRFGVDFGGVRVHTDSRATKMANGVNALAFTVGKDLVFGPGQYAPETNRGKRLLAHELTHTLQQRASPPVIRRQPRGPEGEPPLSLPEPPNSLTVDILDPLNFHLRLQGWTFPSPRDVLNGLDALRHMTRQPTPTFPPPNQQPLDLTDAQIRELTCRTLPHLCQGGTTPLIIPHLPTIPPLTLPRPQIPYLLFVAHKIYDHFIFDNDAIPDRHRLDMDSTATRMIDEPRLIADIYGHTDTRGAPSHNQRLSERRANTVKNHFLGRNVPPVQIWNVTGLGETQPRFPNDQVDNLAAARNRRVELDLRQFSWTWTLFPDLNLRLPQPTTLGIRDPRTRVLPAERTMFNNLRTFLIQVRVGITGLLNNPPAGEPWVRSDNENIIQMLERLDALIGDFRAERCVVRFNLPGVGNVAASYSFLEDVMNLRPFTTDEARNQVSGSLVHEYSHHVQDAVGEQLQRAARQPIEHTREDELRQETEARRHEVYFTRLISLLGHSVGFHDEVTARVFLRDFERERTGSPTVQAAARRDIRHAIEGPYAAQLSANAPAARYLIEVRGNRHAVLIRAGNAETDLGAVPANITTRSQLNTHLFNQIHANPIRPSLLRSASGTQYAVIMFVVFDAGQKVAEFGDRPP